MKIATVVPSGDMVHADFAFNYAAMISYQILSSDVQLGVINPRSSLVQKGRYDGVKNALDMKADKILFIDSDQTFPVDALTRLIHHNKPIVGATCRQRRKPHEFTARDIDGNRIDFSQLTGLHKVSTNGFPFCLIDASVFKEVAEPWFSVGFANGKWRGEDESFCLDAADKGYSVWVDADLSKEIGHIGQKVY